MESTYNWYWLVDGLMDAGYKVHLSNPVGESSAILRVEIFGDNEPSNGCPLGSAS